MNLLELQVVFPIHNGDQMYAVVFNLTYPQVHIIDSIQTKSLEKTYGMTPTSLVSFHLLLLIVLNLQYNIFNNVILLIYIAEIVLYTISGENYIYRQ